MTSAINRTDIHRPSVIKPEEYEFIGIVYDPREQTEVGGAAMLAEERENIRHFMKSHGAKWAGHEHGGTCQCCGANALYLAAFYHEPSKEVIRVGEDCAQKLGFGCENAFNTARRQVANAKEYAAGKMKAQAVLSEMGLSQAWDIWKMTNRPDFYEENTVNDMVRNLIRYGSLSEKQEAFMRKLLHTINHREEIEAQRAAEKAAAQDCPTGRLVVTGTVLTTKMVEGSYGSTLKMLVKAQEGYTLWGTVPSALTVERGDAVTFKATIEPAKNDPKHGFFSRPSAQK